MYYINTLPVIFACKYDGSGDNKRQKNCIALQPDIWYLKIYNLLFEHVQLILVDLRICTHIYKTFILNHESLKSYLQQRYQSLTLDLLSQIYLIRTSSLHFSCS